MSVEALFSDFDRLMQSPESVHRLRRFILDLAVRGTLVPQDPADEPAAALLKRIAKEKARLVKEGKIHKQVPFLSLDPNEALFDLPSSWTWTPSTYPSYIVSDKGKKVQTKDVIKSGKFPVVDQGKQFIRGYHNDGSKVIHVKEPLILFGDHTRETKLIDFDFIVGADGVKLLQPVSIYQRYYFMALQWLPLDNRGYGRHFKLLKTSFIPLPPLPEQHRIVAKVEELMGLCDRLEAAQMERETTRTRLTAASLARLNTPESDEVQFREHAAFALDNLTPLTTRPEQVKALRRTILNLAVRGKLVPQDSGEEPAAELLQRIAKEKTRGRRREQVDIQTESAKELEDVPANWSVVPLITLGSWAIGSGFPKNEQGSTDGPYFFLKVSDMNLAENEKFITTANNCIDEAAAKRIRAKIHPAGTIIFPKIGGAIATNKRRILTKGSAIDNNCLGMTFSGELNIEWAYLLLASLDFTQYQAGTAVPALSQGTLAKIPVGLPPLAEQRRIVAKVDKLMGLCDRLEGNLSVGDEGQGRLVSTLLHKALDPYETLGVDIKN